MKVALIFGITGQDGSYLARLLLKKRYIVHGVKRRSSSLNTKRIDDIYVEPFSKNQNFILHYGDITDALSTTNLINKIKPDEIYNLAAQSHVAVSFDVPEYTANKRAWSIKNIRNNKNSKKINFIKRVLLKCLVKSIKYLK